MIINYLLFISMLQLFLFQIQSYSKFAIEWQVNFIITFSLMLLCSSMKLKCHIEIMSNSKLIQLEIIKHLLYFCSSCKPSCLSPLDI
jgi:hypothetical protein